MKAGELGKVHQAKVCGIQHWREHHNYSQRGFHNRQNLQSYQWQNQEAAPCKRMRTMCIEAFQRPEDTWADRRVPGEPEIEDVFETAAIRLQSVLDAEEYASLTSLDLSAFCYLVRYGKSWCDLFRGRRRTLEFVTFWISLCLSESSMFCNLENVGEHTDRKLRPRES